MKNIIEVCKKFCNYSLFDPVKLRLRGRGSRFKEGPEDKGIYLNI
jgi:hypothetical protein